MNRQDSCIARHVITAGYFIVKQRNALFHSIGDVISVISGHGDRPYASGRQT